nr:hypothetical protein [Geodermatophilus sp. TF02-6]
MLTADVDSADTARAVADRLGIEARVHQVDPEGPWAKRSGAGPVGTVLVRPDGVTAWRTSDRADAAHIDEALRAVLDR